MTADEKLKHFDPSDVDQAQRLAYAALELLEHCAKVHDADARRFVTISSAMRKTSHALGLDFHEFESGELNSIDVVNRVIRAK